LFNYYLLLHLSGGVSYVWGEMGERRKMGRKRARKWPQKRGLGGRQVGAFSVFRARHTGIPFIFWRFSLFFQKIDRLRGWCNITPVCLSKWWSGSCSSTHIGLTGLVDGWMTRWPIATWAPTIIFPLHNLPALVLMLKNNNTTIHSFIIYTTNIPYSYYSIQLGLGVWVLERVGVGRGEGESEWDVDWCPSNCWYKIK